MAGKKRIKDIQAKVIEKAWKDPRFKKRLLENPNEAIKEITGFDLPKEIKIKVIEDTHRSHTIVLPPSPAEQEVLDEELDRFVGGAGSGCAYSHPSSTYC